MWDCAVSDAVVTTAESGPTAPVAAAVVPPSTPPVPPVGSFPVDVRVGPELRPRRFGPTGETSRRSSRGREAVLQRNRRWVAPQRSCAARLRSIRER